MQNLLNSVRRSIHPLYHLRKKVWFRCLQKAIDPDIRVKSYGCKMYIKLVRDLSLVLPNDARECNVHRLFGQAIASHGPDIFLDIGANVGTFSWHAKSLGVPEIFLFEPDVVNARLLARTVKYNHFGSTFVLPCAVSNGFGTSKFIVDQASGATGSLVDHSANSLSLHSAYGMSRMVSVPTVCLDAYTEYCRGKKVMIKIDVEGAEDQVFEGGSRFFAELQPITFIECFEPSRLYPFQRLGYEITVLDANGNFLLMPRSSEVGSRL